jgi:hypothetical protein
VKVGACGTKLLKRVINEHHWQAGLRLPFRFNAEASRTCGSRQARKSFSLARVRQQAVGGLLTDSENSTTVIGGTVALRTQAGGEKPLHHQGQFNGLDLPGETNRVLRLNQVQLSAAGEYRVVVSAQWIDDQFLR